MTRFQDTGIPTTGEMVAIMAVQLHGITLPADECDAVALMLGDMRRSLDAVAPIIGWTDEPAEFLSVLEELGEPTDD